MSDVEQFDSQKAAWLENFGVVRPDFFFPASWNDETRSKVLEEIRPQNTRTAMFASIPLKCQGPACPFADICPLQQQGIAPIHAPCPYEMAMAVQFMEEYINELHVNPANLIEVSMVRDLVDQEIQYLRKTKLLSQEHFIQENVVGTDSEGRPIMRKELHQAVELEDRLHRRKRDLRNQLLATRESRAKAGQGSVDSAQAIANIVEEVAKRRALKERELQRRLGIEDRDDYIVDAEVVPEDEA